MQRGPIQSQMACQDARRAFPYMVAGEIPLTEWALLERHVAGCDECRAELDRLREEAAARTRATQWKTRRSVLIAAAALVVIVGTGLYVHQFGLPQILPTESFQFSTLWPSASTEPAPPAAPAPAAPSAPKRLPPPSVSTPPTDVPPATGRVPRSAATAEPAPVAPRPGPSSEPSPSAHHPPATKSAPPAPKPEAVAKPVPPPAPAAKPAPAPATVVTPSPSASTATASEERMPSQGSTGRVINAAPTAETMPTQGPSPSRSRQ